MNIEAFLRWQLVQEKTFTAIGGIKELEKEVGPLAVVVAVPSITLISQWRTELSKWDLPSLTNQKNKNWKTEFKDEIDLIKYKKSETSITIVLHYNTYAKKEFLELLEKIPIPLLFYFCLFLLHINTNV